VVHTRDFQRSGFFSVTLVYLLEGCVILFPPFNFNPALENHLLLFERDSLGNNQKTAER
jgi:hypothetical protein